MATLQHVMTTGACDPQVISKQRKIYKNKKIYIINFR